MRLNLKNLLLVGLVLCLGTALVRGKVQATSERSLGNGAYPDRTKAFDMPLQGNAEALIRARAKAFTTRSNTSTLECAGVNDTAIISGANLIGGTLIIPSGITCASESQTISATLVIENGGLLKPLTGQTVVLAGAQNQDSWQKFTNALSGQGKILFNGSGSVIPDWWAPNTVQGKTDTTAAIQAAVDSLTRGGVVKLLAETYLTGQINIKAHGTTLEGQGAHTSPQGPKATTLLFQGLPNAQSGIVDTGFYGLTVRNLYLELTTGTGGAAIKVSNASQVLIENVGFTTLRGRTSVGIQFSDRGANAANAVTASTIRHCTGGGTAETVFFIGAGSTSIHLDNVYALGAARSGIEFYRATYSQVTASAVDSGLGTAYAYLIDASTGITITSSGAEANGKGYCRITGGSTGVTVIGGRGVGNNTSADSTIGSFVQIDTGGNYGITIIGGTDTSPNAATKHSIHAETGTLWTNLIGYNSTSFPKGYDGDSTWKGNFLSVIAGGELIVGSVTARSAQLLTGPKPSCNEITRGTVWYVAGGPGAKDTFEVCAKDAQNVFAWRVLY